MCCSIHRSHSVDQPSCHGHTDCSCGIFTVSKLLVAVYLLSVSVLCVRGEDVHSRLDLTSNRGSVDINQANATISNGGNFEDFWLHLPEKFDEAVFLNSDDDKITANEDVDHNEEDHDEDDDDDDDFDSVRAYHVVGAAIVMVAVGFFGMFLPIMIAGTSSSLMRACNAFGAGGFWGLALTHILLEATDSCSELKVGIHFDSGSFMNAVYPLSLLGYVCMTFIETLTKCLIKRRDYRLHKEGSSISSLTTANVITATLGLAVHSVLEGMIVGIRDEVQLIWFASLSVCLHKWAVCFSLSSRLRSSSSSAYVYWTTMIIFVISSGVGAIIGLFIGAHDSVPAAVINALCIGILIHVAAELTQEVLCEEHSGHFTGLVVEDPEKQVSTEQLHGKPSLWKASVNLVLLAGGAATIFGVTCLHLAAPGGHEHTA